MLLLLLIVFQAQDDIPPHFIVEYLFACGLKSAGVTYGEQALHDSAKETITPDGRVAIAITLAKHMKADGNALGAVTVLTEKLKLVTSSSQLSDKLYPVLMDCAATVLHKPSVLTASKCMCMHACMCSLSPLCSLDVVVFAVEDIRAVVRDIITSIHSRTSPPSLTLQCCVMIGYGALGDIDSLHKSIDTALATASDVNLTKFQRVQARTAVYDAAIDAYSYCGLHEKWRSIQGQVLADDEVNAL